MDLDDSPPANIAFIAELGVRLVERQLDTIDKLDSKAGVLWGSSVEA
jgi:hypothetical protein